MEMPKKPVKEDLNQRVSDLGTRSDMPDRIEPGVLFVKAPGAMLIFNRDHRLCHPNEAEGPISSSNAHDRSRENAIIMAVTRRVDMAGGLGDNTVTD